MDWTSTLEERVEAAIGGRGQRALLAVSGGADSMAVLEAMSEIGPRIGVALHVAHLDHGWRPSGAAALVWQRCQALGLPLTLGRLPRGWAPSEDRAREERRRFLAQVAWAVEADAVLLAHHGTDQAETVLAHLMQGSGGRGLAGMAEGAGTLWLRPLLDVPGRDIRAWAKRRQLVYEDDPTNRDEAHLRNWIRHRLLAEMASRQPRVEAALVRSARLAGRDEAALSAEADAWLGDREVSLGGLLLTSPAEASDAVLARIAYRLLETLGRRPTEGQVLALARALKSGGGGGRGLWVARLGPRLWVGGSQVLPPLTPQAAPRPGETICLPGPLPPGLIDMELSPLVGPLAVRGWRPGDRLASGGGLGPVWKGAAVPRPLRPRVPLVVGRAGVLAVLGVKGPWQGRGGWVFSASAAVLADRSGRPGLFGVPADDCDKLGGPALSTKAARGRPVRKGASARS